VPLTQILKLKKVTEGEGMKKILVLLSVVLLCFVGTAHGTLVSMKFTFDDGSPVTGNVVLYRVATPADVQIGTYTLDVQGRVSSDIALDPTATYHAKLLAPNGTPLQEVWTVNASSAIVTAAINVLPTGELDVVLSKANSSVKNVQFVPFALALPQTKFASCTSTPAGTTGPTTDTGGGLVEGYIVAGQTFDCQVQVPAAGNYPLNVRAMCGGSPCGSVHFEYPAGTRVGTAASIPYSGPWSADKYTTVSAGSVTLPQGTVRIRVVVDSVYLALNWFD
jgi:hypothetical protein